MSSPDIGLQFPPYGLMPASWLDPAGPEVAPGPWVQTVDYVKWLEAVADSIARLLWPRYDQASAQWVGDARDGMFALTQADFDLFTRLRPKLNQAIWPGRTETHQVFFEFEDTDDYFTDNGKLAQDRSFDRSLRNYFQRSTYYEPIHYIIANNYDPLFFKYNGAVDLHLKRRLQRPRALQMAWLMERKDFSYERAGSAASPSTISGHCFQALIGGIASFIDAAKKGASDKTLAVLAQHAVDIGDRRVFAGVHYPSDNLSSWITVMAIFPFLFPDEVKARDWAWEAVSRQSAVFQAIDGKVGTARPYQAAWELLHRLATSPFSEIGNILGL
jgi:hypothetical protein